MIGESVARLPSRAAPDRIDGLSSLLDGAALPGVASPPGGVDLECLQPLSAATLCDLAEALTSVMAGQRRRTSVRVRGGAETLEVGLDLTGEGLLGSLYSTGSTVEVYVHERRLDAGVLAGALAAELVRRARAAPDAEADPMVAAARRVAAPRSTGARSVEAPAPVSVEPNDDRPFAFGADVTLRPCAAPPGSASVLRADVLPLLFRGRLRVHTGDQVRELTDVHVFLLAERLADLALEVLEASVRMRSFWRKIEVGGATCGVRLVGGRGSDSLAFSLGPRRRPSARIDGWTFPSVELGVFARAVADFGRALSRSIVRADRALAQNLRIVELRGKLREVSQMLRELDPGDTLVNASPESYRAYAAPISRSAGRAEVAHGRLRFAPKWTAAVPAIDLRSIFLCGDAFLVGSAREISCIQRNAGEIAWTRPVTQAVSVITPSGLARIDESGQLLLIEVSSGETRATLRLEPRVGGPVTGAVVTSPGLPRLLVVSEGRRNLAGVDLEAGEVLWRLATRRGGTFRLKRAGRLVIVSAGEQGLFAVDVLTGEVVWRFRARLRFASAAAVCDDSAFALAGDAASGGGARLFHLDPWSGASRWSADLPRHARPVGSPHVGRRAVLVVTVGSRGSSVLAFDRATGELLYEREACRGQAAALMVDDALVLNSESGELCALAATDGSLLYRHVFAETVEGDRPRRLDPVLRSGALFAPQTQVHVVRPSDGQLVGAVATDLVPDLVRVDERCDVYVAEESGHVAAFSAAARLSVVK